MSSRRDAAAPAISVVLPTYGRALALARTLESVLTQATSRAYEVIVVDNNSPDDTREVVARVGQAHNVPVRYVFEPRQGVSYARNAAIDVARAPILAFVDDDVQVAPDWVETIARVFDERPEADCIGGKVLPVWEAEPPEWLTADHWAPLALLDFGDTVQLIDSRNRLCLLTANLACRRDVLDRVGAFRPELQRVKDSIGSMEDYEWLLRFWAEGGRALYIPALHAWTEVPVARTSRKYHRRWHSGRGFYFALLRDPEFEQSRTGRVFDVPAHVFRAAVAEGREWLGCMLRGDGARAFLHETRIRFMWSYVRTRIRSRGGLFPHTSQAVPTPR